MIKTLGCAARHPDLTHDAFLEYVSTTHLEVVASVREWVGPVRQYMQNHLFVDPKPLKPIQNLLIATDIDYISEVWYDNVEALRRAREAPGYGTIIKEDDRRFGDVESVWGLVTDEIPVMQRAGFAGHIKLFIFLKRTAGLSHAELLEKWRELCDQTLTRTRCFEHVGRIVENHVKQGLANNPLPRTRDYDLVAEMWFESFESIAKLSQDKKAISALLNNKFIDAASILIYAAEEKPETADWLRRVHARWGSQPDKQI